MTVRMTMSLKNFQASLDSRTYNGTSDCPYEHNTSYGSTHPGRYVQQKSLDLFNQWHVGTLMYSRPSSPNKELTFLSVNGIKNQSRSIPRTGTTSVESSTTQNESRKRSRPILPLFSPIQASRSNQLINSVKFL